MKRIGTKIRRHAVAALFALSVGGSSPLVTLTSTTAGVATSPLSSPGYSNGIWYIGGVEVSLKQATR